MCLLAPIAVTFTFLHYRKNQVREGISQQIKVGIDKDELILLKFSEEESKNKLQWKHLKEFKFKNEMYDIVKSRIKGDSIYYWCWKDNEETKIDNKLNELTSLALGDDPPSRNSKKQFLHFYKLLFYTDKNLPSNVQFQPKQEHFFYSFNSVIFSPSPLHPPPQLS